MQVFEVRSFERTCFFAGRLGKRVEERIVLLRDGQEFRVEVGRWHTRVSSFPSLKIGQQVSLGVDLRKDHLNKVHPDQIRRLEPESVR